LSKPIQAHSPQRRARHERRYDSALLVSSRSHEETLNLSIENNDFTVTFDTRLPITGAQEHLAMEYTYDLIATVVSLISFRSGVELGFLIERMHYEDGTSQEVALE
jgi:tryptophan synthase alpha subunit